MKFNKIFLGLVLLLLIGCSNESTVVENKDNMPSAGTNLNSEVKSDSDLNQGTIAGGISKSTDDKELKNEFDSSDALTGLKEIIKLSDQTRVFPKSKKLTVGDEFSFATGFTNHLHENITLIAEVVFKDAKSTGLSNNIIVDEETVLSWIQKPDLGIYTIPENDYLFFPIDVVVGEEIKEGVKTQNGAYTFEIITYDNSTAYRSQKTDYEIFHKYKFTVIVN